MPLSDNLEEKIPEDWQEVTDEKIVAHVFFATQENYREGIFDILKTIPEVTELTRIGTRELSEIVTSEGRRWLSIRRPLDGVQNTILAKIVTENYEQYENVIRNKMNFNGIEKITPHLARKEGFSSWKRNKPGR